MIVHRPTPRHPAYRDTLWLGLWKVCLVFVLLGLGTRTGRACVGTGCMQIWSTADGGGALAVQWDYTVPVQTYASFCTPDNSSCLYTTIDPGFMATTVAVPGSGYFRLVDGTTATIKVLSADPGLSININGTKLYQLGDSAHLGTMPTIHVHPSWQLVAPGDQFGNFRISFQLTSSPPTYSDSPVYTAIVTNIVPTPAASPTPSPTPQATPTPPPCAGDCNSDLEVTVDELITCVDMALGIGGNCPHCDANHDGMVTVDEIVLSVNAALNGCPMPTPATLAEIQQTIFTPSCAQAFCHDMASHTGNLILVDGLSYAQLVNVTPSVPLAAQAGQLRVDPGHPDNSFLLVKLLGPPLGEGSPMPLTGGPLPADQIDLIRQWILEGAQP